MSQSVGGEWFLITPFVIVVTCPKSLEEMFFFFEGGKHFCEFPGTLPEEGGKGSK